MDFPLALRPGWWLLLFRVRASGFYLASIVEIHVYLLGSKELYRLVSLGRFGREVNHEMFVLATG